MRRFDVSNMSKLAKGCEMEEVLKALSVLQLVSPASAALFPHRLADVDVCMERKNPISTAGGGRAVVMRCVSVWDAATETFFHA